MGVLVDEGGMLIWCWCFAGWDGLDEQAVEVARHLRFSPATKSRKSIPYWQKLAVEFNLR